jgi:hypothetical protein
LCGINVKGKKKKKKKKKKSDEWQDKDEPDSEE